MELEQLQGFSTYLLGKGFSNNTVSSYLKKINGFYLWMERCTAVIENISYSDLLDYIEYLKPTHKPHTIQQKISILSHYFNYLIRENYLTHNPAASLHLRSKGHQINHPVLSREQLDNLYDEYPLPDHSTPLQKAVAKRNKLIVGLMVFQGLGTHALANLSATDIHPDQGEVRLTTTRKQAARVLALQPPQVMEAYRYLEDTRPQLITHYQPHQPERLMIHGYKHYYAMQEQRLLPQLKAHHPQVQSTNQIRASVIIHWLKQHNLRQVQYMAGHKRITNTEIYRQNDVEELQQAINTHFPF